MTTRQQMRDAAAQAGFEAGKNDLLNHKKRLEEIGTELSMVIASLGNAYGINDPKTKRVQEILKEIDSEIDSLENAITLPSS